MSDHLVREQTRVVGEAEGVWTCPCESQLFFLSEDGSVYCSQCRRVNQAIVWQRVRTH
jgi:hypothetical protein